MICRRLSNIKSLLHFEWLADEVSGELWTKTGNPKLAGTEPSYDVQSEPKFGYMCAYFPDVNSTIEATNASKIFDISPKGNYEIEAFVKISDIPIGEYKYYDGHTFKLFSVSKTWEEAEEFCEELGGHLATSTSAEKNDFLTTLANGKIIWLGLTDKDNEGTWQWVTGEELNYTHWSGGEPNDAGRIEDYCELYASGYWNDMTPTATRTFICEWDTLKNFGSIFTIGEIILSVNLLGQLTLLTETSTVTLTADTWQHILLRISDSTAKVFLDGVEVLSAPITTKISPEQIILGGYVGYMDEFVFRNCAGTDPPKIPTEAYSARKSENDIECFGTEGNGDVIITRNNQVNFYGMCSNSETSKHNELTGLQGGQAGEYYHLTGRQITKINDLLELFYPDEEPDDEDYRPIIDLDQIIHCILGEDMTEYEVTGQNVTLTIN